MKPQVEGKIVLVGKPTFIDQSRDPAPKHLTDEDIKCRMDPTKRPADCGPHGDGARGHRNVSDAAGRTR